jgi:hypothetical protein
MYQFSDLALARMRSGGNFTGYFDVVLLTRAPSVVPSNAPAAITNLLADMGYQELVGSATPRFQVQSSQSSTVAGTPPVTTRSVLLGSDMALPSDVPPTYIDAAAIVWHGTTAGGAGAALGSTKALVTSVGTASTPDTPDMTITGPVRLTFRARIDSYGAGFPFILSKEAAGAREFYVYGYAPGNNVMNFSTQATGGGTEDATIVQPTPLGAPHTFGAEFAPGSATFTGIVDGARTTTVLGDTYASPNTGAPVLIGNTGIVSQIYWAQLETLAGAVIWRFDANDYPGTGTSYVDPRGRTWTLTSAAAVTDVDTVTNPWLVITDESFRQVVYPGSVLTTVAQSPRVLWRWSLRGTNVDLTWPGVVRSPGTVAWEPPRTEHVFLYPQKVNYVPNPSFEEGGLFGWRSSGVLTRVVGGVDNPANFYGHTTGTRLESIPAPLASRFVCISAYVRSTGATWVRLGLANWSEAWTPSADSLSAQLPVVNTWTRLSYVAAMPDNVNGSGALFVSDGSFDVDLVLMETGAELHDYFDGDSQTALAGDISWQGVTHQSYSFWYNNRYLVGARLFGVYKDGLIQEGLVYDWVPAGTSIYTHWNVLSMTDTGQPLVDFASRSI